MSMRSSVCVEALGPKRGVRLPWWQSRCVVVAGSRSAPIASVTVGTLGMTGVVKTLGNEAPLHGQVFHAVYRTTFVDAPS
jgi:hypothetical protein